MYPMCQGLANAQYANDLLGPKMHSMQRVVYYKKK